MGKEPFALGSQVFPQFPACGEAHQFRVRHGGPEEIGKPGGEGIFIQSRMGLGVVRGKGSFHAEEEAGGGQHRGEGAGDAFLESAVRSRHGLPGEGGEADTGGGSADDLQ